MINLDESETHCQDKPGGSTNMSRLQAYDSFIWVYFCTDYIKYIIVAKSFTNYTYSLSLQDFKKYIEIMNMSFQRNRSKNNSLVISSV